MNIGYFFMHPPGESMGSTYRVWNLCQGLTKMSHKCYIFTPFHYSEDWGPLVEFVSIPVVSKKTGINIPKLIYKIVRKIFDFKILSNYSLLNPHMLELTIKRISNRLIELIIKYSYDLDVFIGQAELGGYVLSKIKDKLKIPIITDYQNYWPEELIEHRVIKRHSRRYKFLVDLERNVIRNSDYIITICQAMADFLKTHFDKNYHSKIEAVNNGGVPFLETPKKKKDPPKIINSGMVVQRSNFKLFLESLEYVIKEYPNAQIFITRKGEKLKKIMKLAKKKKLNVNFYWKNTNIEYLDFLSECHIGVVTSTNSLTRKLGFVAKVYDYFSVGIPVVGNDIGGFTSIISDEKVGSLSSNDPRDLADKIIHLIENPDLASEYGERGINLLKGKLSIDENAKKLVKIIENLL
ncbi:MAG: glycosyltransferase family 4 protein [Promethearchaeota archaeon]